MGVVARVEVDGVGEGVVVVAAEEPPRQDGVEGGGNCADGVAPETVDGVVIYQAAPFAAGGVLVDTLHLDVPQVVGGQIVW